MKELKKLLALLGLTLLFISCESPVKFSDYIDKTTSFTLTINQLNQTTGLTNSTQTEIEIKSEKCAKLIEWIEKNNNGWTIAHASYISKISVSQDNFHLRYYPEGSVVLSFVDKEGKGRQYTKEIKVGELDFLTDN